MKSKVYNVSDDFNNISISVKTANIEIFKSQTQEVKIVCSERKCFAYSIHVENNTLEIKTGKRKWFTYFLPYFKNNQISLYVPQDVLENIKIKTVTSKIKIFDIVCSSLEVQNVTGKIELDKVIAKNKINIKNNTGKVYFNGSDASEIFVKTNTGSVGGILLSEKAFIVKTKTGKINIPNSFGTSRCQIISNTGNINFEIKDKE